MKELVEDICTKCKEWFPRYENETHTLCDKCTKSNHSEMMTCTCTKCQEKFTTVISVQKNGRMCIECKKENNRAARRNNYKKKKLQDFYRGL